MTIKEFKEIVDIAKNIKADIIYISGNRIYGTDKQLTILKTMEFDNIYNIKICYENKDIVSALKDATSYTMYDDHILFDNSILVPINNPNYIYNIIKNENTILEMKTKGKLSYTDNNIKNDKNFQDILNLKSCNGARMYIANNYKMYLFSRLLPINKSDNVELNIYDINNLYFMSHFTIKKKKLNEINQYMVYIKI